MLSWGVFFRHIQLVVHHKSVMVTLSPHLHISRGGVTWPDHSKRNWQLCLDGRGNRSKRTFYCGFTEFQLLCFTLFKRNICKSHLHHVEMLWIALNWQKVAVEMQLLVDWATDFGDSWKFIFYGFFCHSSIPLGDAFTATVSSDLFKKRPSGASQTKEVV